MSTVPAIIYAPDGSYEYVVTVRDAVGTVCVNAQVQLVFSAHADALVCWCQGQSHPLVSEFSDGAGEAHFFIEAGGCLDPNADPQATIEVLANGVLLATVGARSADAVDDDGVFPWNGWNPGTRCRAGLGDLVVAVNPIQSATLGWCWDFNDNGTIDLNDAVILTAPLRAGAFCPR